MVDREMKGDKLGNRLGMVVVLVLGWAGTAGAFLDTGTLLTNSASATYMGGGQGTSVTYSATAKILVANPAVFLWKDCTPTVVATVGGLVTCTLCFSNGGANTAFNVTINDRLPNGTGAYWRGYATGGMPGACAPVLVPGFWVGGGTAGWASYSVDGGSSWVNGTPPMGQQAPAGGLMLRWRVQSLGIGVSGCVSFLMSVG